jgi:hypothetical protein
LVVLAEGASVERAVDLAVRLCEPHGARRLTVVAGGRPLLSGSMALCNDLTCGGSASLYEDDLADAERLLTEARARAPYDVEVGTRLVLGGRSWRGQVLEIREQEGCDVIVGCAQSAPWILRAFTRTPLRWLEHRLPVPLIRMVEPSGPWTAEPERYPAHVHG